MADECVVPFIDLASQYRPIWSEIKQAIETVVMRCDFILGREVAEFESAFSRFIGAEHAVGVSSGLDALRLALSAMDVGAGDEVIVPANSYIATALAVSAVGATPVFVDCDPATYEIAVDQIEGAITPRSKVIIPVHLTGQSADMDPILQVASQHGLRVIEDAAQAHGTKYNGRSCGAIGDAGCFSFYPGKNLGGFGDGGLVTTGDKCLADRVRRLRNYGQHQKYEHVEKGLNARLDTLQAAILNVTITHLSDWNAVRALLAQEYRKRLQGIRQVRMQDLATYSTHVYHLFIIETESRNALQAWLRSRGIQTGIHYPRPIHLQKAYCELGYFRGDFPNSESLSERMLSLPMSPALSVQNIAYVCNEIGTFFSEQPSTTDRASFDQQI